MFHLATSIVLHDGKVVLPPAAPLCAAAVYTCMSPSSYSVSGRKAATIMFSIFQLTV